MGKLAYVPLPPTGFGVGLQTMDAVWNIGIGPR